MFVCRSSPRIQRVALRIRESLFHDTQGLLLLVYLPQFGDVFVQIRFFQLSCASLVQIVESFLLRREQRTSSAPPTHPSPRDASLGASRKEMIPFSMTNTLDLFSMANNF